MRSSWKIIRFRVEPLMPRQKPCPVERVLAEAGEELTAKICCEALHRFLGRRRGESWYVQSPEGKRYQMLRQDATFEEVEIGGAPPRALSLISEGPSNLRQRNGGGEA